MEIFSNRLSTSKVRYFFLLYLLLLSNASFAQKKRIAKLPSKLHEISGLAFLNDSTLIAHADSGADPTLFILSKTGMILHEVQVLNASNVDWEDITIDNKGNLYIADIGNNVNKRKDLCIYKISTRNIVESESVTAEKISFYYPEQNLFPPANNDLYFDAEAITFFNDSLHIFTKCRTDPWDGKSYHYTLPCEPGRYAANKLSEMYIGKNGFWKDAITAAEYRSGNWYLLTYNRLLIYSSKNNQLLLERKIPFDLVSQYEAVAVNSKGKIYIADERNKLLGGGYLYRVKSEKKVKK